MTFPACSFQLRVYARVKFASIRIHWFRYLNLSNRKYCFLHSFIGLWMRKQELKLALASLCQKRQQLIYLNSSTVYLIVNFNSYIAFFIQLRLSKPAYFHMVAYAIPLGSNHLYHKYVLFPVSLRSSLLFVIDEMSISTVHN